jgi:signal transduction histidine kinase
MLFDFLKENRNEILAAAARDSLMLAGSRPSSLQLEAGLPFFFEQLQNILRYEKPKDTELAMSAGQFGLELLRLGYTLSHTVHVYGSLCQSITSLATKLNDRMTSEEFQSLNRCLDVAIASAVTEYQRLRDTQVKELEIQRCGFCAHELRNALSAANMSFQLIKSGVVGISGSTGQILEKNLLLLEKFIGRSMTEVKLGHAKIEISSQQTNLLLLVDSILITAGIEAKAKGQHIDLQISPSLNIEVDPQFLHSALSNLIQNAIKYSHADSKIQIRAAVAENNVHIEVEDECGGLAPNAEVDLFKPFEQQNQNRTGLGLGLNIARRAVELHGGTLGVRNLPGRGCVFTISLPRASSEFSSIFALRA